ncbi:MAG TPA: hypothetical protein PKZ26_01190 [Anaerolineaceae bacterium]|nr:hypothetical protein [Anaerolineaceae bacterium]HOQ68616.1 hypothetical protein [Anaerolineaceae bacterium]HOS52953.1 hypothetical protein [Anaerolineaceae bacterium]HPD62499.1 hypothetical protein [Anaerolineaceae bacterium]HQF68177.1 hypothetical protein [Anaerolineaceae bacterium]
MKISERIQKEMDMAFAARKQGNEGMARVCARRAAGIVVRDFLDQHGIEAAGLNNFEILVDESVRKSLPASVLPALQHLTMRVDENYALPTGIDLLADAQAVIQTLLKEVSE